jgi:hypothetical protein
MQPIEFVYSINGTAFEKVDQIKDLEVIMSGIMSFFPHIEAIISNYLAFIKLFQESLVTCILIKLYTLH